MFIFLKTQIFDRNLTKASLATFFLVHYLVPGDTSKAAQSNTKNGHLEPDKSHAENQRKRWEEPKNAYNVAF